jgi:signal peptidase I
MFDKWRRYSYAAQKHQRYRLLKAVFIFLSLYILYNLLSAFGFSVWTLENSAMQSGLRPGDRLIFVSFAIPNLLSEIRPGLRFLPFKRGNIVLIDTTVPENRKKSLAVLDGAVRFFTAQRVSLFEKEESLYLKRIIGLPGDEIGMTNFVFRVKPSGQSYGFTEFEHSEKPYQPVIPQAPALWDESLPFSGNMDSVVLGSNECFVVSDNRANTNDSRTWGPISQDMIRARAIFRFWPLTRIGRP